MRQLLTLLLVISLGACCAKKESIKAQNKMDLVEVNLLQGCPDQSNCKVEIMENKRIHYKQEETTGKFFPEMIEDESMNVVQITMDFNRDEAVADGQYREMIVFEWPKDKRELHLTDENLQDVQLLFGRFCFCEPSTVGYFKVTEGSMEIADGNMKINWKSPLKVRQAFSEVVANYRLK